MSYTFSDIDQLTYGFQGKLSPGFSELISTWQRDCIDENYLFWSKQVFNLKLFLRLWQKPSLFGRKSFGSIVKTALSNSRQIFDESIFLENSSIFSKFLILMKNNRRHLTQKFYRQDSQNWNLRVQTIILIESFKRKTPLSISEFQRKLFVLLEGKMLQLSQNFSVYVQLKICLETIHLGRIKITKTIEKLSWKFLDVWRNEFGGVVKSAFHESRRIFEEEMFFGENKFSQVFLDFGQKS